MVLRTTKYGHRQTMCLKLKLGLSSSYLLQSDKRSARNLMVIARMPENRSKTIEPPMPYTPVRVRL
eukprot:3688972-Heterocapsa_arctica.AAC.1